MMTGTKVLQESESLDPSDDSGPLEPPDHELVQCTPVFLIKTLLEAAEICERNQT